MTKGMTKPQVKRFLLKLAKHYKIKLTFKRKLLHNAGGLAKAHKSEIIVRSTDPSNTMICTFFHEVGHVMNFRNKKYITYHSYDNFTYSSILKFIATAIKAEKYTDKVAKKLMKQYWPTLRYRGYTKKGLTWLMKTHLKHIRESRMYRRALAWRRRK